LNVDSLGGVTVFPKPLAEFQGAYFLGEGKEKREEREK